MAGTDPETYGIPDSLWDKGFALRAGNGWLTSDPLSPTAVLPAFWYWRCGGTHTFIEEIIVYTDTAMTLTVGYSPANPAQAQGTVKGRLTNQNQGLIVYIPAVAALPVGINAFSTLLLYVGQPNRILYDHWIDANAGNAFIVYTPATAANLILTAMGTEW